MNEREHPSSTRFGIGRVLSFSNSQSHSRHMSSHQGESDKSIGYQKLKEQSSRFKASGGYGSAKQDESLLEILRKKDAARKSQSTDKWIDENYFKYFSYDEFAREEQQRKEVRQKLDSMYKIELEEKSEERR